ncbi:MAG: hypothetical protein ACR2RF_05665 [Geminicoccaceae bacterium]
MRQFFAATLIFVLWPQLLAAQTIGDADVLPVSEPAPLPYGLYVSPAVSTLGLGLEAGARLNESFGLRFGGNWFSLDADREIDDVDYDAEATLASLGALVDYHPFKGGFRLSGGLRFNFNEADLTGRPNEDVEIGDVVFDADDVGTLDGDVSFDVLAPYLGVGYGAALLDGSLSIGFDLGVMYQGKADVNLDAEDGLLEGDPVLEAELAAEEEDVENDLEDFQFYPVIGLAVVYRF